MEVFVQSMLILLLVSSIFTRGETQEGVGSILENPASSSTLLTPNNSETSTESTISVKTTTSAETTRSTSNITSAINIAYPVTTTNISLTTNTWINVDTYVTIPTKITTPHTTENYTMDNETSTISSDANTKELKTSGVSTTTLPTTTTTDSVNSALNYSSTDVNIPVIEPTTTVVTSTSSATSGTTTSPATSGTTTSPATSGTTTSSATSSTTTSALTSPLESIASTSITQTINAVNETSTFPEKPSNAGLISIRTSLLITVPVVVGVVIILVILWKYRCLHRDKLCRRSRKRDQEYVDCDHELYSTVNVYTNFRHHGARADFPPMNQEQKLMTKMETEDEDHQYTNVDLLEPPDSDHYVSPEGLVYVTVSHELGKGMKKKLQKNKVHENEIQYACLDFKKTGKYVIREDHKNRKGKRIKGKRK